MAAFCNDYVQGAQEDAVTKPGRAACINHNLVMLRVAGVAALGMFGYMLSVLKPGRLCSAVIAAEVLLGLTYNPSWLPGKSDEM